MTSTNFCTRCPVGYQAAAARARSPWRRWVHWWTH
jgi:hypothetical protein